MKHYKELQAYQKLKKRIGELTVFLNKQDPEFVKQHQDMMYAFTILKSKLDQFYMVDPRGNRPRMDELQIRELKDAYTGAKTMLSVIREDYITGKTAPKKDTARFDALDRMLEDDLKLVEKVDARDYLPLPAAVYKADREMKRADYVDGKFKWPGFYEYTFIYPKKPEEEILEEFIRKSPEEVERTYKEAIEREPRRYEYTSVKNVVPPEIRNTSDVGKIQSFLEKNDDKLSFKQKTRLKKLAEVSQKVQAIEQQAGEAMDRGEEVGSKVKVRSNGPEDAHIDDVHMPHQSSGNGCWSCAGLLLAESRGNGKLRQEDIRGYRPKLGDGDVVLNDDETDYAYSNDKVKNLMEMGDSILAFAPNSMLHELAISNYSRDIEKAGITRETYINNTVALMKKQILHAIKEEHSPVAILLPGHYVTITGINGDTIEYKNSSKMNADQVQKMSLKDLVTKEFSKPTNDPKRLGMFQLTWISDIKLAADQKTIHGVPSVYAQMKEDGEIELPPEDVQSLAAGEMMSINRKGVRIHRGGGDELANVDNTFDAFKNAGVQMVEKVYLPKKLNAQYLKTMAAQRDPKEEEKLAEADEKIYGIPRDREGARKRVDRARGQQVPEVEKNQPEAENPEAAQPEENQKQSSRLKTMRDVVKKLGKEMDKHQHFYLRSPKQQYSNLAIKLSEIEELAEKGLESAAAKDGKFTEKDAARMVKCMDEALRQGQAYLKLKCKELTDDPRRKNAPGKQKNEQARIRAVLDACEELVKLKEQVNGKVQDVPLPGERMEGVRAELSEYRRIMVSGKSDPKREHEATYKNRIDFSKVPLAPLNRLEAIFGIEPEYLKEFEDPSYFKKEPNKSTTFRRIKTIHESMPAIGEGGKNDKLSNKDFVALACAAATTRKVFAPEQERLDKIPLANWLGKDAAFHNYGHNCLETATSLVYDHGMTGHIPAVERSRNMVKDAMLEYKKGNKKPLAGIISEGITNMVRSSRKNLYGLRDTNLYLSEMCQRMMAMLERDPELMDQTLKAGLQPEDMKYVRAMEQQGRAAARERELFNTFPDLSEDERKEWYTDYVTSLLLNESTALCQKEMEQSPEYKNAWKALNDKCDAQIDQIERDLEEEFVTKFQKLPDAKTLCGEIQQSWKKDEAQNQGNESFVERMKDYAKAQNEFVKNYKAELLDRRKEELDRMDADRLAEKKPPMTEKERLDAAVNMERQEVERYRVADSPKEQAQFDKEKQDLGIFMAVRDDAETFLSHAASQPSKYGDVERIRLNLQNELQVKLCPKDPVREAFADPDMVQWIRDKVQTYVTGNQLYKLDSKAFCESLCQDGDIRKGVAPGIGTRIDSYVRKVKEERQAAKQVVNQDPQAVNQGLQAVNQGPQVVNQNPQAARQQAQRNRSNTVQGRKNGTQEAVRPRSASMGAGNGLR